MRYLGKQGYAMQHLIRLSTAVFIAGVGHALAEVPRVITDIPPVHSLVAQVMGDLGTPDLLLERGASEHDFQLRPSQAAALQEADVVFWIGPALTPWLARAMESAPPSVAQLELLDVAGTVLRPYDQGDADHADEDHQTGDHDHDHEHGSVDPHAWLLPANAQVWLPAIADELARIDPENAAAYAANAAAAAAQIAATDATVMAMLAPVADQPIIVFHEAFGYYAAQYGLTIAGAISEGDAAAPSATRLTALRAMVVAGGVICLFPEVQHDPALVAQMVEGTSARIGGALDPVGSSFDPGPAMYADLMTGMADTIAACLAGD
jgi:zinc transport system substrate-binding protein